MLILAKPSLSLFEIIWHTVAKLRRFMFLNSGQLQQGLLQHQLDYGYYRHQKNNFLNTPLKIWKNMDLWIRVCGLLGKIHKISFVGTFLPWLTFSSHPGGNQMLAAGGKAVMPFWQRFARHLDSAGNPTAVVLKELRSRIVGNLDTPPDEASITDPYLFEPDRSDTQLKLLQQRPYNAGQDHSQLKDFITEIPQVFIRHHRSGTAL